MFIVFG